MPPVSDTTDGILINLSAIYTRKNNGSKPPAYIEELLSPYSIQNNALQQSKGLNSFQNKQLIACKNVLKPKRTQ